jgi:hypothetical protein
MPATATANRPTSLKLPAVLKSQLEQDAQNAGISLHALMIQTLAESVKRTRLKESFAQDSKIALDTMKTSNQGYELGDVKAYFSAMAQHRQGLQPRPQDLQPTRLA